MTLHLHDDADHPLLRFYKKFELGLGIVDSDIQLVLQERQLFERFLSYLDEVRNVQGADALVAVSLPQVNLIAIPKVAIHGDKQLGCVISPAVTHQNPSIYPQSPFCNVSHSMRQGEHCGSDAKLKSLR